MKKNVTAWIIGGLITLSLTGVVFPQAVGHGAAAATSEIIPVAMSTASDLPASNTIPFPDGYNTTTEGASSYNGLGNVTNSQYYPALDFYRMKSTASLTILTNFKTYQQTTEATCGPAAALMVLYHFGNKAWDELAIAKIMKTDDKVGTSTTGMVTFFKSIGWNVKSSLKAAKHDGKTFSSVKEFKDFTIQQLANNTPVMVENIDWAGHWRVIIGYDTMGTETTADDVMILGDSYDTGDHLQDGYVINSAEKFFYTWYFFFFFFFFQKKQQWLIANPPAN